jgi:hypothetical protein
VRERTKRAVTYYVYGWRGDRFRAFMIDDGNAMGGIITGMKREGWRVFWRRL